MYICSGLKFKGKLYYLNLPSTLCLSPLPLFYFGSILVLSFLEITFIDPLLTVLCRKGLFASLLEKLEIGHYTILKYGLPKNAVGVESQGRAKSRNLKAR